MKPEDYSYRVVVEVDFRKPIYSGKEEIGFLPSTYMEIIANINGVIPYFVEMVEHEMAKRLIPMTLDVEGYLSSYYMFKIETTPDFKDEVKVAFDEVIKEARGITELIQSESDRVKDKVNSVENDNFTYFEEVVPHPTNEGLNFKMFEVAEEGEVTDD